LSARLAELRSLNVLGLALRALHSERPRAELMCTVYDRRLRMSSNGTAHKTLKYYPCTEERKDRDILPALLLPNPTKSTVRILQERSS